MEKTAVKRIVITVAVALLVATAGCNSITGGGDGGDGGDGASGSGYDVAASDLNATAIDAATSSAVDEAGSYTLVTEIESSGEQSGESYTSTTTQTTKVDLEANMGLRTSNSTTSAGDFAGGSTVTVVYSTENASYQKRGSGSAAEYTSTEDERAFISEVNVTGFDQDYESTIEAFNWTKDGSESVSGTATTKYSASSITNASAFGFGESSTINNASGAIYIDSDGVLRKAELSYTVTSESSGFGDSTPTESTSTISVTTTLKDVGSTSVSEPGWLSEAQS